MPTKLNDPPAADEATAPAAAPADAARPTVATCPVCGGRRLYYAFSKHGHRVVSCTDCRFMLLNPQPSDAQLAAIYDRGYFIGSDDPVERQRVAEMKSATAAHYLDLIGRYRGDHGGRLLELGCGQGELLAEAERLGYEVTGVERSESAVETARRRLGGGADGRGVICRELGDARFEPRSFDVCVLADVIEHVRDPLATLRAIRQLLKPDGVLLIVTPSLDSWSARVLRYNWMEFKPEHLSYFAPATIQTALFRAGFYGTIVKPGWKVLNLDYVAGHFARFPVPLVGTFVRLASLLAPAPLRRRHVRVVASGIAVLARAGDGAIDESQRKLSVIVPAYNEAATLDTLMRSLLRKEIPRLDIEVILVESNSTDGTRQVAESYRDHPRVRVVLEERPRGKGHAVREGLRHATGDFILIQDADLEYDLDDYDALLEPLLAHREAFVLGSRHGGNAWWKMRTFTRQPLLSLGLNFGHWFFTILLNVLYLKRLRDPFTMYKVFRRDCLCGLAFRCDRFDFDIELLVKLLRKGCRAIEIPVNYRSRSFHEGKKVSVIRDPMTWLAAMIRLRFARIDPLAEIERHRAARRTG